MDNTYIKSICSSEGFAVAEIIDTAQLLFDASFRPYCKENLCGQYGANYSCPPDCGSPEVLKQKVLQHNRTLVMQTVWLIPDLNDEAAISHARRTHNNNTLHVINRLNRDGFHGFMIGASGCLLCDPCKATQNQPCNFPELRYSCISAYCIHVKDMAEKCGMAYDYKDEMLSFFSMYVFDLPDRKDGNANMKNSSSFFRNYECSCFPCHAVEDPERFNCMFCYCPLYRMEDCGGDYKRTATGVKDCSDCTYPHKPENYQTIVDRLF